MAPIPGGSASARRLARALVAIASAFALLASSMGGSTASTRSKLDAAKNRLTALTGQIGSEEAQAQTLQAQLSALEAQISDATSRVAQIDAELAATRRDLARAAAQADRLQAKLNTMARALFMQGAGSMQEALLGPLLASPSMGDLGDLLTTGQIVAQSNVDLATHVSNVKAELAFKTADLNQLRSQQVQLMAQLTTERASKAQAIAQQQAVLGNLERTKTEIVDLIARLHKQLRAEALAAVGTAFQGPGHVAYGAWAGLFLRTIDASECRANLITVVAWQYSEFTQAEWNPLADTLAMPGSTTFNSVGVQNYASVDQGLQATRYTLVNGPWLGYGAILSGLAACADPMTTARAINASMWCRGCAGGAYVVNDIAKVEVNYDLYAQL
jgi:peptidoglycan hydrolase CwlO-like protein